MDGLRFVHAADLHLGSPFAGLAAVDPAVGEVLRRATFDAFERILGLCREEKADFLLLAGDVYDAEDRNVAAQLRFARGLNELAEDGIAAFVVHGNHDPLTGKARAVRLHDRVHVFGHGGVTARSFPGGAGGAGGAGAPGERARIYGISYGRRDVTENLAARFRKEAGAPFAVMLLHANLAGTAGHADYAPCSVEDLVATGMDYAALGHVHTRTVRRAGGGVFAYPGTPQGRSIRECGPRGCLVVDVQGEGGARETTVDFRAVDAVRWEVAEQPIDGLPDLPALLEALAARGDALRAAADGRPVVARFRLTGRGPVHADLAGPGARTDFETELRVRLAEDTPFVCVERIEDATNGPWDRDRLRQGEGFVAALVRFAEGARSDPALQAAARAALAELHGRGVPGPAGAPPDDEALLQLLARAEALCLDRLLAQDPPC